MKKVLWVLLPLVLAGAGGAFYLQQKRAKYDRWRRAAIPMSEPFARVPAPWSAQTLASRLEKSGKIRDSQTFLEYAQEVGLQNVSAGAYGLPQTASPKDLAQLFKNGPTHQKITFPEGFTGVQMAARLSKNGFDGAGFEKFVYEGKDGNLEGFLFPDTYVFPLKARGEDLARRMRARFDEQVKSLGKINLPQVKGQPISRGDWVKVASLLEREAVDAGEMPLVARVIYNRLEMPMRLQIDATIQYARVLDGSGHKSRLLYDDLKKETPYNSYQNDGLPPTPISNPGLAALKAAANPAKSDALFYVYSPKLRHHRFARAYGDHLRNIRLAKQERAARETASGG